MTQLNRRNFIHCAAGVAAGAALGTRVSPAVAQTPIKRTGGPQLKLSLNAYCFNALLLESQKSPGQGLTLLNVLDYCAEQNFDAIDPTGYYFPGYPKVPNEQFLNDFKRRAFALGIAVSGTGVRNDFTQRDKAAREADLKLTKEWIEVAARMGAPVLRVFAGKEIKEERFDETAKRLVEELQKCVEHGKRHGVVIGIQNHGDALKTADQVLQIVKMVDSEWFGVVVDTGNFQVGDTYKSIAQVAPYAVNWQIKEKIDGKDGTQKIDLPKTLRIVREAGYRGYLPIETLSPTGAQYEPRTRVAEFLKDVRAAMQTT